MLTFRCSSLDRVLHCNGSMTLVPLVSAREGDEGAEGTAIHWLAHARMKVELSAGGDIGKQPAMPKSLAFSAWVGDWYFDHVKETVPADWSLECEVPLAYEFTYGVEPYSGTIPFALSGHIDALALNADATEAIGFDLKTGFDPVDPAEENWQMLGYVVLLLQAYPTLRKVTFWVVQPRNDEDEGFERASSVVIEGDRLRNATRTLIGELAKAINNRMEVNTGIKACKWCPAAMQCAAQIELRELMKATLTPELLAAVKATPDDAALAEWVIAGRTLNRPIEDAEAMLKERIRQKGFADAPDGTRVTIKTQGGSYSFPDPVAFYRETRKLIPDDAVYAGTVKPSVTKTVDALAKVYGLPKSSKAGPSGRSTFDGALGPLVEQGTKEILVFQ
jgi:hypothetical protein